MSIKEMFNLSDRAYEIIKWFVLIVLPAFGAFYGTVGSAWGAPATEQVLATVTGLSLLLGTILKISSSNYTVPDPDLSGTLRIDESDALKDTYSLDLNDSIFGLSDGDVISFKVEHVEPAKSDD